VIAQLPSPSFMVESQHNSAVHVLLAIQVVGLWAFDPEMCLQPPILERIDIIYHFERSHGLVDGWLVQLCKGKNNKLFVAKPHNEVHTVAKAALIHFGCDTDIGDIISFIRERLHLHVPKCWIQAHFRPMESMAQESTAQTLGPPLPVNTLLHDRSHHRTSQRMNPRSISRNNTPSSTDRACPSIQD